MYTQTGLFQNFATDQHRISATMLAQMITNKVALMLDFLGTEPVHHGKQVITPAFPAWATIAMTDKVEVAHLLAQPINMGIIHIPDRHSVMAVTQTIMVGNCSNAANGTAI